MNALICIRNLGRFFRAFEQIEATLTERDRKLSFLMNLLDSNGVLGLEIGSTIQVIFASSEAHTLLGTKTEAEMQAILEGAHFFPNLKEKLESQVSKDGKEGLRLSVAIVETRNQKHFTFYVQSANAKSALVMMMPTRQRAGDDDKAN
jgi:hypothetical protein